jgi:RND superfamily putative drug exporter
VFARLGRWSFHRRKTVVLLWILGLFVLGGVMGAAGNGFKSEFTLPDVESKRGFDILDSEFGGQGAGLTGTIVFTAEQGVDDPEVQTTMEDYFDEVRGIEDGIVSIQSPYDEGGEQQIATQGPLAGQLAYANIEVPEDTSLEEIEPIVVEMREMRPELDGLRILTGGGNFAEFEEPSSEILGVGFAMVILILAFGSVLAMGLPVGVALAGIGIGTILITLLSNVITMPDFSTTLGIMIGLGVGIDYALFIVTRYRENLHLGHTVEESVTIAIDTAGRAVAFAGTTVVISLMGMLIMQLSFVSGLAIGAATVVAVTMVASLTLLPALLGFAGEKIEVTKWGGLIVAGFVAIGLVMTGLGVSAVASLAFGLALVVLLARLVTYLLRRFTGSELGRSLRREVPRPERPPVERTVAYRWSRWIQHHPWTAFLIGATTLIVLALPIFFLRMGFSDEGNYATDTDARQAYDLLAEGFGPGFNGPFIAVTELPEGTDPAVLDDITAAVGGTEGVAFVSPVVVSDDGTAALWRVTPTTSPQDHDTTDLVRTLRNDVLPDAAEGAGLDIAVTGNVPVQIDFSTYLADRMVYFFAAVLGLSFLLLMVVFRSVLVPLKAVIMNLLSIGAAFGIVVAGFQWGWFGPLLNIEGAPIEPFVPMMLFAIVFGLSMDYEVFLLSRIKEDWDRNHDSHLSVANGLAATAKVITAAALIMVFVFGSFLLENDRIIKLFGVGLATAVLLDATIVRMLLVPATMELLGDRNWWVPKWLDRILPHIEVEGHVEPEEPTPPPELEPELERV